MNCSPPVSSACGIYQARILEWVAISFSRGLNLHLLYWQVDSLPPSHLGSPKHSIYLLIIWIYLKNTRWVWFKILKPVIIILVKKNLVLSSMPSNHLCYYRNKAFLSSILVIFLNMWHDNVGYSSTWLFISWILSC